MLVCICAIECTVCHANVTPVCAWQLKLTKVDLDRLATKTCAENDASFPPVEPVGSAFCLPEQEAHEIFAVLDRNGDGVIPHAELIRGLRENAQLSSKLGMPSHIRAEDGTRTAYQLAFGMMDTDDSKTISVDELLEFCGQGRNVSSKASAASAAATPATSCTGVRIGARVRIHGIWHRFSQDWRTSMSGKANLRV